MVQKDKTITIKANEELIDLIVGGILNMQVYYIDKLTKARDEKDKYIIAHYENCIKELDEKLTKYREIQNTFKEVF